MSTFMRISRGSTGIARLLAAATLLLFATACGSAEAIQPPVATTVPAAERDVQPSTVSESEAMIWLVAPSGDYQEGWARLWEEEGSLFVQVDVVPSEPVAQPAHIHIGDCQELGGVVHRLENVIDGHSLSELPGVTLAELATGELAVNLHESFANFNTFTACGEIPGL